MEPPLLQLVKSTASGTSPRAPLGHDSHPGLGSLPWAYGMAAISTSPLFLADGYHPNQAGFEIMVGAIAEAIRQTRRLPVNGR